MSINGQTVRRSRDDHDFLDPNSPDYVLRMRFMVITFALCAVFWAAVFVWLKRLLGG
jgi:hypothetical protein